VTRILALGDTQLGVQTVTLESQAQVLDRIADAAIEHRADLVLHGGDVFEGPVVLPEQMRVFLDFAARLREAGIPLLVLRGNGRHDMATRDVHALDVLHEIENVEVHDRPGHTAHEGVGVVTLPWVAPGNLIAQWGREVDHDQVNDYAGKLLVEIAASELERLRNGRFVHDSAVLVAHWGISGATLPTGLAVEQMREPILSWPDLDALGFDAIIGAHVHQQQRLDHPDLGDATVGFVVGSPQQLNHGETGEHGVWILDIEPGATGNAVSAEFVPIASPRFVTLDLHADDIAGGLMRMSGEHDLPAVREGDIVRIRFEASEEQAGRIDHRWVREWALQTGASRVQIDPHIVRASRARSEAITDRLSPTEALAAYCESEGIEPAMRERMVSTLKNWSEA
jgi:DNA repair exonuclease SbcCD nuclease subunit